MLQAKCYTEDGTKVDPKTMNPARAALLDIINNLVPPPNYRVILDVDRDTEKLMLKVLKRDLVVYRLFGIKVWTSRQDWNHPECFQRKLTSRTYDGLLLQLRDCPEFLEFEIATEGAQAYRTAYGV